MNRKWLIAIVICIALILAALLLWDQSPLSSKKSISSISFLMQDNPTLKEDIFIEVSNDTITGAVPYGTQIDALVPVIDYQGAKLLSGTTQISSGTSPINLGSPTTIAVVAGNGSQRDYYVDIKYFTGLPMIYLFTPEKTPITSRTSYLQGNFVLEEVPLANDDFKEVKIRGRGNTSWGFPKRSFQIKFDEKEALLGMPADKRWLLLANYSDKSLMRNEIAFEMGRISNLKWTPESRFVELFINNQYRGVYQLTQKVEESKNRVNIGDEGFLVETERSEKIRPKDVLFRSARQQWSVKEPEIKINDENYNFIKNTITEIETVLFGKNFADPLTGYEKYIDVASFVDWYLISEITRNNDAIFHSSVYMHLKPGEKLTMGPIWDYDIAMGNINYRGNEKTEGFYIKEKTPWITRLFEDPKFVAMVKERMKYFAANKDYLMGKIQSTAKSLQYSQEYNFKVWPILGQYIWPNSVYFDTYDKEVIFLSSWLDKRITWLDTAVAGL